MVKSTKSTKEEKCKDSSGALIKYEVLRFRAKDYEHTIGVDEAGRGPLAGPVVAAACSFLGDPESVMDIEEIRDSKMITQEDYYNTHIYILRFLCQGCNVQSKHKHRRSFRYKRESGRECRPSMPYNYREYSIWDPGQDPGQKWSVGSVITRNGVNGVSPKISPKSQNPNGNGWQKSVHKLRIHPVVDDMTIHFGRR
jgi:hypothetical protein